MNAQKIIDTCNKREFSREQFRNEFNISWLINETIMEYKKQNA